MSSFEKALAIIRFFKDKNGFDDWWSDVDEDTRDEVIYALARELKEMEVQ